MAKAQPAARAMTVAECAAVLKLTQRQIDHAVRKRGAPFVRRGRRGAGGAWLVDPIEFAAWMRTPGTVKNRAKAERLINAIADSHVQIFRLYSGPNKFQLAGNLIGAFYAAAIMIYKEFDLPPFTPPAIPASIKQLIELVESTSERVDLTDFDMVRI